MGEKSAKKEGNSRQPWIQARKVLSVRRLRDNEKRFAQGEGEPGVCG